MPPRKRLGQLLTELAVIDEHQLQSALGHQKQWGGKLGSVLVQKGFCKEAEVVTALSKHLGMPAVKLADAKIDSRAVKFVSKQIAEKLHVFPYEISGTGRGEVVTIAMSDPTDLSAVDQLAFHTGKRIKPMLAGDSEIVQAIQTHYGGGDDKAKPGSPAAAPAGARPAAAPAPATAAVASEFPRRIGPTPVTMPSAGSARAAPAVATPVSSARAAPAGGTPYIPPPIPPQPAKPSQKLEEIEPDETMSVPTPPAPKPEPLEIPEDDGQMMGLEPIAAHSQFGDQVAGQEEVDGAGSAGDAVEGLVTAGVPHEGAAEAGQIEGLEPIAAHAQAPLPEGGWGAEAASAEAWQGEAAPAESAAPEAGWGEETPAAAAPSGDFGSAQDWGSAAGHQEGWGAELPATQGGEQPPAEGAGWGAEQPWSAEAGAGEAPVAEGEQAGEELPMDAILGSAAATEGAPEEPAWGAEAAPEQAEHEPEHEHEHEHEHVPEALAEQTEAPDAWASSEDPLAASGETAALSEGAQQEQPWNAPPEPSADRPSTDKFSVSAAAETPAESAAAETEAPPEWSETPAEPHHEAPAETPQEAGAEAALAAGGAAAEVATHEFAAEEPHEPAAEEPHQVFVAEEPHHEPAAEQAPPEVFFDEASAEGAEQGELKIEGWIAPPPEPEPQGAGWLGQALEATAPLSAADHGTLASIGVDPNDGVGALRLLAVLVRVLNRGHQLNLDEIGNEIRDSRAQAAAEHAAAEVGANGTPASEDQPPAEPAET